jgi:hypothetical protein
VKTGAGIGPPPLAHQTFLKPTMPRNLSGAFLFGDYCYVRKWERHHRFGNTSPHQLDRVPRLTERRTKRSYSDGAVQESAKLAQSCQGG